MEDLARWNQIGWVQTLQVRLDDAVESEEIFSTLMGENVEARRKFIEENALYVKNLDV